MIGLLMVVGEVVRGAGVRVRSGESAEPSRRAPSRSGISCAPQLQPNRTPDSLNARCVIPARSAQSLITNSLNH